MKKVLLALLVLFLTSSAYAFIPSYETPGPEAGDKGRNELEISKDTHGSKLDRDNSVMRKDMLKEAGSTGHGGAWDGKSPGSGTK